MDTCCKKSAKTCHASTRKNVTWWLCSPFLLLIYVYQIVLSPFLGPSCRFEPTCSYYAKEALLTHGPIKGLWLAIKRLAMCHPFGRSGFDPVPPKKTSDINNIDT